MTRPTPNPMMEHGGPGPLFPVAHRDDPLSSYAAGERVHKSKRAATHYWQILRVLKVHGRLTSKQVAYFAGVMGFAEIDRHEAARRLPDLFKAGQVKRKDFTGTARETEWWIE